MKTFVITKKEIERIKLLVLGTTNGLHVNNLLEGLPELEYATGGVVEKPDNLPLMGEQASDYGEMYGLFGDSEPTPAPIEEPDPKLEAIARLLQSSEREEREKAAARRAFKESIARAELAKAKRNPVLMVNDPLNSSLVWEETDSPTLTYTNQIVSKVDDRAD